MALQKELANRYLLGSATDAENEEIGVRIIEDPSFTDEISQAEYDLIEDHLEGSLSDSEHKLFEVGYLISDERRARVAEIVLLKRYSARYLPRNALQDTASSGDFTPWYRRMQFLVPAFGVVTILAAVGFLLFDRERAAEPDYALLNRQDLRDPTVFGNAQIVEVRPGNFRSGQSTATASPDVVAGSSQDSKAPVSILFRLPIPFQTNANAVFNAVIESEGRKVFEVDGIRLYNSESGASESRLLAPYGLLNRGIYQIKLTRQGSDELPILYPFEVR